MSFKTVTNQALIAIMLAIALIAGPMIVAPVQLNAQVNPVQTLTQTTLSAAVGTAAAGANTSSNTGGSNISVTSATGFTVGYRVFVITGGLTEAMDITAVSGTVITVTRGVAGTTRHYHASGDVLLVQRAALFNSQGPTSNCVSATTSTGATALVASTTTPTPWVDIAHGDIYYCAGTQWVQTVRNGFPLGMDGATHAFLYTVAGALFPVPGIHSIGTGGALAMTLAPPTKDRDGMIMIITASTAQAHTVTYTAGFSQSTTSSDVATFGGAVNDGMVIVAVGGVWQVISTRNVTIA